jgi:transposase
MHARARTVNALSQTVQRDSVDAVAVAAPLDDLGDVTRLSASRKAVRCAVLDVGVHRSDRRSRVGKLTRQGSPQLRWALFEAAQSACRPRSPDHPRSAPAASRTRARR